MEPPNPAPGAEKRPAPGLGARRLGRERVRLVVFDFDDTLAETGIDFPAVKRRVAERLRREGLWQGTPDEAVSTPLPLLVERAAGRPELSAALLALVEEAEAEGLARLRWSPGLEAALSGLRGLGLRLAVLTNNAREPVRRVLEEAGLEPLFDAVAGREDVPAMKPRPDGLLALCKRLGAAPSEALFVGDSEVDERAARAAGVAFARYLRPGDRGAFRPQGAGRPGEPGGWPEIERLEELVAMLGDGEIPDREAPAAGRPQKREPQPESAKGPLIAYQGEPGAHSEAAALAWRSGAETAGRPTVHDVFAAVAAGTADYGLVPVENAYAGTVGETLDGFLEFDVAIVGEVYQPIHHHLMALPGARLEAIRRVLSHPQALAQCAESLRSRGWEAVAARDTAGAARELRSRADRAGVGREGVPLPPELAETGVLASRRAAALYRLEILLENVEDRPDNATRFWVIARREAAESAARAGAAGPDGPGGSARPSGERWKTTLVMATEHTPGALWRALGVFARRQVNLSKLESRPNRRRPWEALFFVDADGDRRREPLAGALAELGEVTTWYRELGSYRAEEPPGPVALP
ncbi:MAG: HAD-IA family hydrolase [Bacillota bacterium]|nr:HAD-IA family hydrolase [Bacillota bacterium]